MTMDVTAPHKQEADAPVEGPGRLLREAREALNLSQDEVARRLHLTMKMVRALEEDDYKQLPPPIFVIGYLRSYARLGNLPADELIASYNRAGGVQPPPIKVLTPSKEGAEHRSDQQVQMATYVVAVVVLVVVLGIGWWQSRDEPAVSVENAQNALPLPLQQPVDHSQVMQVPVPGAADTTQAPAAAPIVPPVTTEIPLPPSLPGTTAKPLAPAPASTVNAPVSVPSSAGETPPAFAPQATIKLTFEADSWVQITDANEQRVFYDLGKGGVTRTLQGTPPFQVVIGYSPGVKIEYNGSPFDHSRFERGERARFVLGK